MAQLTDHRALVTGASSGIGAEMARVLASWGCDLVLTARRTDRLEQLAQELRERHGVRVHCVPIDLSATDGAASLWQTATEADARIDILINNAGFGEFTEFARAELERSLDMIQLNIGSLVELTHRFLGAALDRSRPAYVLNVASIAAFQPVPFMSAYTGTKSFVLSFTDSLAAELSGSNVHVASLCPGGTRTEFSEVAGQPLGRIAKSSMIDADVVARQGLTALFRGRRSLVTGTVNKVSCFLLRFVPRSTGAWAARQIIGTPRSARSEREIPPSD